MLTPTRLDEIEKRLKRIEMWIENHELPSMFKDHDMIWDETKKRVRK